mgnify:CR=1 FL=1
MLLEPVAVVLPDTIPPRQAREEIDRYEDAAISVITWMEVLVGARDPGEDVRLRAFLRRFPLLPLEAPVAEEAVAQAALDLGGSLEQAFMALSFLALPVIPKLKLTDRGLVDVERFTHVSLFV